MAEHEGFRPSNLFALMCSELRDDDSLLEVEREASLWPLALEAELSVETVLDSLLRFESLSSKAQMESSCYHLSRVWLGSGEPAKMVSQYLEEV